MKNNYVKSTEKPTSVFFYRTFLTNYFANMGFYVTLYNQRIVYKKDKG